MLQLRMFRTGRSTIRVAQSTNGRTPKDCLRERFPY
jgi:hypothetical protein